MPFPQHLYCVEENSTNVHINSNMAFNTFSKIVCITSLHLIKLKPSVNYFIELTENQFSIS